MTGAENLLSALWGNGENAVLQITSISAGSVKNILVPSVSGAISKALELNALGCDVYHACAIYESGESRKASNALGAFGFWLDIDCGESKSVEGKGYLTKKEAAQALQQFLTNTNLPLPTHIIDSGNGLHVYFLCECMIHKEEWLKSAKQLKCLTNYYGFLADDSRTADIASIL